MSTRAQLDITGVAEIGLLFLNGDLMETVLIDKVGQMDYVFDEFNELKRVVMKIERLNPELKLTCILWKPTYENDEIAEPLVCGNQHPTEGWGYSPMNDAMKQAYKGENSVFARANGPVSNYFPIYNSDHEIVGFMELLSNIKVRVDI